MLLALSGVLWRLFVWVHGGRHTWCELEDMQGALIALVCPCGEYKPQVLVSSPQREARSTT